MVFKKGNKINLGRHKSEETKKRISLGNIGKHSELGIKRSEVARLNISLGKIGNKNPMWKGDKVGYHSLHIWIRCRLLKPELCEVCNIKPSIDLANVTGIYNRDFTNWKYLCRSCHMKSDGRINNLKQYGLSEMR